MLGLKPHDRNLLTLSSVAPIECDSDSMTDIIPLEKPVARSSPSLPAQSTTDAALIYVVDDDEGLTELYTIFLKGTGYLVRSFNSRTEALQALTTDDVVPDLLIMDYVGHAMPPHWFIQRCLLLHPALRILVASGLSHSDLLCPDVQPLRFLQKPFTARKFLEEVSAALAA